MLMESILLAAFGLMLIMEGILPFLFPQAWRDTFRRMVEMKDGQLRFVGLASIVVGLMLLMLAR